MEEEIQKCVDLLLAGKVILYPTDTIWGLGCDATNETAVRRIFEIKRRQESRSLLILLDKADKLPLYVKKIPLIAWDLLAITERPTTYIYPTAYNLPQCMIPADGSIAIRIVQNPFCQQLIRALDRPLVSTSANISGHASPATYSEIAPEIFQSADHTVPESFANSTDFKPSRIIKFTDDYNFTVIRE
ncbi:MAG: threonylcarbamoyl-AMP synthase [Bacteroidales bacterium]|nr:threonylcarbamoyl-AMP synthase [Bacteroidales bacterium]